jgi:hypothetical protein
MITYVVRSAAEVAVGKGKKILGWQSDFWCFQNQAQPRSLGHRSRIQKTVYFEFSVENF